MSRPRPSVPRVVLGALLLVGGVLAFLHSAGVLHEDLLSGWWPLAVAAVGLLQLAFGDNRYAKALGLVLLLLGAALTVARTNPGLLDLDRVLEVGWPLLVVALGVFVLVRSLVPRGAPDSGDRVSVLAIWSGQERRVEARAFEGGELTAIMGGFDLDLRGAEMAPGSEALLDVLMVMGGGEIRVPEDWTVDSSVLPLMGGVSVKARGSADARRVLRVRGLVLMAGLEIRN